MADPQLDTSLEGALASQPVLGPYLGMKQYLQRQQRDEQTQALQQQFLQERQNLGPNASPQDLMNLATRYADPQTLLHYGLASQDRKEATAARDCGCYCKCSGIRFCRHSRGRSWWWRWIHGTKEKLPNISNSSRRLLRN